VRAGCCGVAGQREDGFRQRVRCSNCDTLLGLLYWTGEKPGIYKNLAAGILNPWAEENDIAVNCDG
jgi:hypothetical protein